MKKSPSAPNLDIQFNADVYAALVQAARTATFIDDRWRCLEAAHVLGQRFLRPHFEVHWLMLRLALACRDGREAIGQVVRLLLVPLGHLTGRLPLGNPGRATVSAFAAMPVRPDLFALIDRARSRGR